MGEKTFGIFFLEQSNIKTHQIVTTYHRLTRALAGSGRARCSAVFASDTSELST